MNTVRKRSELLGIYNRPKGVYGRSFSFGYVAYTAFLLAISLWCCKAVLATDEVQSSQPYVISFGDQLLITVFGHEKELTSLVVVREDGMITYPWVGDIEAVGLTTMELSSAIGEKLVDYYENPQVTVQLKNSSRETIFVLGDVKEPGRIVFADPVSVVKAVAAAGGFLRTADLANAKILKRWGETIPVDLERFLKKGLMEQGIVSDELSDDRFTLGNGDVLIIPSAVKEEQVSIIGHVRESGCYTVKSSISLIEALALAGGPLENTADLRHVKIIGMDGSLVVADATRAWADTSLNQRSTHTTPRQNEGKTNPLDQCIINPGDSVFVPEKGKINVIGSVKTQGQFSVDGDIGVIEALALAGVEDNAKLDKLRIIRSTGEQLTVDASRVWKQGAQEAEERLAPGDTLVVPRAFRINWTAVSTIALIFSTLYAIFR